MSVERISPRCSPSRRTSLLWVSGWLVLFGVMSYSAAMQKCATFDEPLHTVSGAIIRQMHDYRVDPEDPALFTWLATIPHSRGELRIDQTSLPFVTVPLEHNTQWNVVIDTLYHTPGNDGAGYVNRSRIVFMLIGIGLGALIAWWAYRIAGPAAAMISATLFSLDPNFLAHASLVKNDVISALLMLWLGYLLWLIGRRFTLVRAACLAVCCAAAVNVKFSGMIFGPITAVGLVVRALMPWEWESGWGLIRTRSRRMALAVVLMAGIAVVCWGMTWGIYAPDRAPQADWVALIRDNHMRELALSSPNVEVASAAQLDAMPISRPVRILLFAKQHRLMPHTWLTGLLYTYNSTISRGCYLLGKQSNAGWWYYFPLVMLFKTPLTILAMMVIGAGLGVVGCVKGNWAKPPFGSEPQGRRQVGWTRICLWVPIVIYAASALSSNLNLGIRHILPLYPFIYILISISVARWMGRAKWALVVAMIVLAVESVSAWPDYIPFFNVACGGERGGERLLGDSNLDWGQDLPLLARWQRDHMGTRLYFSYFGSVDPAYYGIWYIDVVGGYTFSNARDYAMSEPGVFAISATSLQAIYYTPSDLRQMKGVLDYLHHRQPVQVLGGSIYLYDWDPADFARYCARKR